MLAAFRFVGDIGVSKGWDVGSDVMDFWGNSSAARWLLKVL